MNTQNNDQIQIIVTPLYDRVLIKPINYEEEKSKGGIILPQKKHSKPLEGIIVAQGPGLESKRMHTNPGDRVMYAKNAGVEVILNGEKFLMMREVEIQAIITIQKIPS